MNIVAEESNDYFFQTIDLHNIIDLFSLLLCNSKERKIWRRRKKLI